MAEPFRRSSSVAPGTLTSEASPQLGPQFLMMFRALVASPQRHKILFLVIALVAIVGATAFVQIKLNAWNQPFYDPLARKDLGPFFAQLQVFVFIPVGLLILKA